MSYYSAKIAADTSQPPLLPADGCLRNNSSRHDNDGARSCVIQEDVPRAKGSLPVMASAW